VASVRGAPPSALDMTDILVSCQAVKMMILYIFMITNIYTDESSHTSGVAASEVIMTPI
jgi:hypothetical protein